MSLSQKAWGRNRGASSPGPFDVLVLTLPNRLIPSCFSLIQKLDCRYMNLALSPLLHLLNQAETTVALSSTSDVSCRVKGRAATEQHRAPWNSSMPSWTLSSSGTPCTILGVLNELSHFCLSTAIQDHFYYPCIVGDETKAQKIELTWQRYTDSK